MSCVCGQFDKRWPALWCVAVIFILLWAGPAVADEAAPVMDGLTGGELPWQRAYDEAMLEGRDAYNAGDRDEAREAFVRAAQILPDRPAAYRNLARNYNLMGEYSKATAFYDVYLRMAPDAGDVDVIREERRGAVSRGGDEPWRPRANQRMARRALERELDDGRALTAEGGGARGLFETLLGTGFVSPDVAQLRQRVEQKLRAEFDAGMEPRDEFLPVLTREGWALQGQRLDALEVVVRDAESLHFVQRRRHIVEAVELLLDGAYEEAAEAVAVAADENGDLSYVGWYRVVALDRAGAPEEALEALDELVAREAFSGQGLRQAQVVRARLLQRLGDDEGAAAAYRRVLEN